ncbi:MAG: periplasmic heavy metal sensor, partial [Pseudomonadota bacterium]
GTAGDTEPGRKRSRWVWIALALSLAVNLLVVGFAVGAAYRLRGWDTDQRVTPIQMFLRDLSAEKRARLRPLLQQRRQMLGAARREARAERRKLRQILRADTFDQAAFDAQRRRHLDAFQKFYEARFANVEDMMAGLTAEERRRLLRALARRRRPRGR